jgi:hypothetical protein
VIVVSAELISLHAPFLVTALYFVVTVRLLNDSVVVVFATEVHVELPVGKYSHLTTVPLWPVTLMLPEFEPLHTVDTVTGLATPAIDVPLTAIFLVKDMAPEVQ